MQYNNPFFLFDSDFLDTISIKYKLHEKVRKQAVVLQRDKKMGNKIHALNVNRITLDPGACDQY